MADEQKKASEHMNAKYRKKAPKFPEELDKKDTNNILAFKTQRLPMKVADPDTPPSHRTFNTLCRYIGASPDLVRDKIHDWVDTHLQWVEEVTAHLLNRRKCTLENFLKEWMHGSFSLDEAGILIMARAYKIHVAVFFNHSYWMTCSSRDLNDCKVFLLYRGSLVFDDSCRMSVAEYTEHKPLFKKLERFYDGYEKKVQMQHLRRTAAQEEEVAKRRRRNYIESNEDDSESSEGQNIMPQSDSTSDKAHQASDHGKDDSEAVQGDNIMPQAEISSDKPKQESAHAKNVSEAVQEENIMPHEESPIEASGDEQNDESSSQKTSNEDSAPSCSNASEGNVSQMDTSTHPSHEENEGKNIMPDKEIPAADPSKEKAVDTSSENSQDVSAQQNIMPDNTSPSKEDSDIDEPAKGLGETSKSDSDDIDQDLEQLMEQGEDQQSESEERSRYQCPNCDKYFISMRSLNKHKQEHVSKPKRVIVTHSKSAPKKGRIPCDVSGCDKDYCTKCALQHHKVNNHSGNQRFYCVERNKDGKDCIKSYPTQQQLDQHVRGIHGDGFVTYCGHSYTWPHERNAHQSECNKCKKIRDGEA